MTAQTRPDVEQELRRLKAFQRATVDRVHQRFWLDHDPARRFLVADEVGLGKTMVARGVIAHTIDHLWEKEDRIDVVYICSNAQIARQNLARLALDGYETDESGHADRLTMLPVALKGLKEKKVNFISFTPKTSFRVEESGGRSRERILLQHMLAHALGSHVLRHVDWLTFFQGRVRRDRYKAALEAFDAGSFDATITARFGADIETAIFSPTSRALRVELEGCVERFRYDRGTATPATSRLRYRLIGQLRGLIARAAVEALEPDLVILDEFQRFKDLLAPGTPGADLAHAIFDQPTARVLLLSATPYKMYTLPDEPEGDDHYQDFKGTVAFLGGDDEAVRVIDHLRTMRTSLLRGDETTARRAKDNVQTRLRRMMSRTERGSSTGERDGMLQQMESSATIPYADDLINFASVSRISLSLPRSPEVFEYWRSSPYVLNIMEQYQLKRTLKAALSAPSPELVDALAAARGLLSWEQFDSYQQLDPGNAKMRGLVTDVLDRGAWRLLWLPPSLPYYAPAGAYADPALQSFTKRLVFSAWAVVPKAISLVLSYEAERRALTHEGGTAGARAYSATRATGLLRFQTDPQTGRETGMPVLASLYPSVALARIGDPLAAARSLGKIPLDRGALLSRVAQAVHEALSELPSPPDGAEDERWYWAAPFLLDAGLGADQRKFLNIMEQWGDEDRDDAESQQTRHVRTARTVRADELGRRPADLNEVLACLAVAGPGVTALRALGRVCGGDESLTSPFVRDRAAYIGWGLRSLFNSPESMAVVRGATEADRYWLSVLKYCLDGNLQSVLDEYVHILVDSEGLQDKDAETRAQRISHAVEDASTLRATRFEIDTVEGPRHAPQLAAHSVRAHFAARFGRGRGNDEQAQREGQVRTAYNSPFWPFVLASTSVGQEGLDFHPYSHAVVHWNLPGNPVDLEQREGRVHRFKGHAVRRNVALTHGAAALDPGEDPWQAVFDRAEGDSGGTNGLTPYWVYAPEGGASIERYVPVAPLSKEAARFARLLRTVGAYRLVIGQPRQEDLLRYLGDDLSQLDWLNINLTP